MAESIAGSGDTLGMDLSKEPSITETEERVRSVVVYGLDGAELCLPHRTLKLVSQCVKCLKETTP